MDRQWRGSLELARNKAEKQNRGKDQGVRLDCGYGIDKGAKSLTIVMPITPVVKGLRPATDEGRWLCATKNGIGRWT